MIKFDMHVHSDNSHDCQFPVESDAISAINNNVSVFAVTDHCDIQYCKDEDVLSRVKSSVDKATEVGRKFEGRVRILKGIELGEAIWDEEYTKKVLSECRFDVIIGSVHAVRYKNYREPYSQIDFSKMSFVEIDEFLNTYFDDVWEMLHKLPCDIMAHLTCPFRYINGKYNINVDVRKYEEKICRILKYIIDNLIAMELNTSGVYTEWGNFMPDEWIVEKYKSMGGFLVTLGSDAHIAENIGKGFEEAVDMLKKYGFEKCCYYIDRKVYFYEI